MARNSEASIRQRMLKNRQRYGKRLASIPAKRVTKLGKRKDRIIGFTVDGVLSRITAAQTASGRRQEYMVIARTGGAVLVAIRRRMQLDKENKTLRGKAKQLIDNRYLKTTGAGPVMPETPLSGPDKSEYEGGWEQLGRLGGISGRYNTSGGLWAGTESRLYNRSFIHEPEGKSLGSTGATSGLRRNSYERVTEGDGSGKKSRKRAANPAVTNRDKSYLVWQRHRVNILEPYPAELQRASAVLAFDLTAGHIAGWAATQSWIDEADRLERQLTGEG